MDYEISFFFYRNFRKRGNYTRGDISLDSIVGALRWFLIKLAIRFVAEKDDNTET